MPSWLQPSVEDPRGFLDVLRRKELYAVMDNEGIEYPKDAPATICRDILRSSDVHVGKYLDEQGNFLWPERKSSPVNVDELKMPQLRKMCARYGVQWTMKDKKVDLQAKLKRKIDG